MAQDPGTLSIWQSFVMRVLRDSTRGGGDSGMIEYRAEVASVFQAADDAHEVLNGTPQHARIVFEEAFCTNKNIILLTHDICDPAFGSSVANAVDRYLRRGNKLQIMVETLPVQGGPLLGTLQRLAQDVDFEVRIVPQEAQAHYSFNAMIVGDAAYRFQRDRTNMVAIVAGGGEHKVIASHIRQELGKAWDVCRPLDLGRFAPASLSVPTAAHAA